MSKKIDIDGIKADAVIRIAHKTIAYRYGEEIAIRLHETDILTFDTVARRLYISTGDYETKVTKRRINDLLKGAYRIYKILGG